MYHFIIKIRKCGRAVVLLFLRKRVQLRKPLCHFNLRNGKCICIADVLYLREINNEDVTQEYNNSFRFWIVTEPFFSDQQFTLIG